MPRGLSNNAESIDPDRGSPPLFLWLVAWHKMLRPQQVAYGLCQHLGHARRIVGQVYIERLRGVLSYVGAPDKIITGCAAPGNIAFAHLRAEAAQNGQIRRYHHPHRKRIH